MNPSIRPRVGDPSNRARVDEPINPSAHGIHQPIGARESFQQPERLRNRGIASVIITAVNTLSRLLSLS